MPALIKIVHTVEAATVAEPDELSPARCAFRYCWPGCGAGKIAHARELAELIAAR